MVDMGIVQYMFVQRFSALQSHYYTHNHDHDEVSLPCVYTQWYTWVQVSHGATAIHMYSTPSVQRVRIYLRHTIVYIVYKQCISYIYRTAIHTHRDMVTSYRNYTRGVVLIPRCKMYLQCTTYNIRTMYVVQYTYNVRILYICIYIYIVTYTIFIYVIQ